MNGIELDQIKFPSYRTRLNSSVYVNEKLQMERKSLCFGYMYIIIYIAYLYEFRFYFFYFPIRSRYRISLVVLRSYEPVYSKTKISKVKLLHP